VTLSRSFTFINAGARLLGPVLQLKGFERIALQPGETRTVKFSLGKEELKYWNPKTKQWIVEPSDFDV
jgi:beta-glucosidase